MHHQLFFHNAKNHAAHHGAPYCTDPANHRHEQDGDAGLEGEDVARIKEGRAAGVNAAGNTGKPRGNGMDPQLGSVGIHAQIGGSVLILLDGAQRQSKLAVGDHRGNHDRQGHCHHGCVVVLQLTERLVFNDSITAGAARDVHVVHDHAHGFSYANGGDHEIGAAQPESGQPDEKDASMAMAAPPRNPKYGLCPACMSSAVV